MEVIVKEGKPQNERIGYMKIVNALIDYCNWDIGDKSSKCVYAVYDGSYTLTAISKCYVDGVLNYFVDVVCFKCSDIFRVSIKAFDDFASAKALFDMMVYSFYEVVVNECEV